MIALVQEGEAQLADMECVRPALCEARKVQEEWARRSVRERAKIIGGLRPIIAAHALELARAVAEINDRPVAEKLVSEVMPLLEACRFLEKNSAKILRTRRFGKLGRPLWLHGSSFETQRKPFGVILIVGPRNYPLFIPLVQALQALTAGNAVALKPAEGTRFLLELFSRLVIGASQLPSGLIQLLPEAPEAARAAARHGIDKAFFTGSSANGRNFLAELAKQNIPSVMELSGADAVFVREDADVELAAKAIAFGLRLNAGDTCMAPHTIIAHERVALRLQAALPTLEIISVSDDAQALQIAALDQHGLGVAIFSRDEKAARALANRLTTGFVTINDLIVPTADPRFPFGGVRASGFGVTRGAEGLLEMTHPQAIAVRRTRFRPHLDRPRAGDEKLFDAFIRAAHGAGWRKRVQGLVDLWRARKRG